MGLDMYAHSVKADLKGKEVDIVYKDLFEDVEMAYQDGLINQDFAYWRKFNNLHGWMHRLYDSKGGANPDFNCANVNLTLEDLTQLEEDATGLKPTDGFFFGFYDDMTAEDVEEVQEFVAKAKAEIADGRVVLYSAWW